MSERYTYLKFSKKLRYRILRGYYKPGEMLPSIRLWQNKKIIIRLQFNGLLKF